MLYLSKATDEFEMISDDTHLYYNTETGEFDFCGDFMAVDSDDFDG